MILEEKETEDTEVSFTRKQLAFLEKLITDKGMFAVIRDSVGSFPAEVPPEVVEKIARARETIPLSIFSKICGVGVITLSLALKGKPATLKTRKAMDKLAALVDYVEKEFEFKFEAAPEPEPEPQAYENPALVNGSHH